MLICAEISDPSSHSPILSKTKSKIFKRNHAHRRSGSMSFSKKLLEEVKIAEPDLPPTYEASPTNISASSECFVCWILLLFALILFFCVVQPAST